MKTKRKNFQPQLVPTKGFSFDADTHSYFFDGSPMTGVTTILQVIAKPLTWWAAGKALEGLGWHNPKYVGEDVRLEAAIKALEKLRELEPKEYDKLLQECYRAHDKTKRDAASTGTDQHGLVEEWILNRIANRMSTTDFSPIQKFIDWAIENKVTFKESEKKVYSKDLWFAGTLDMVFEKDGKLWIGDLKTTGGIYPSQFYQMAAYRIAWEEMGLQELSGGSMIIRMKGDEFEVRERHDFLNDSKGFLGALNIYRANALFE